MKEVKRLLLLVWLLLPLAVFAGEVNEAEARKYAMSFLTARGKQLPAKTSLKLSARGRMKKGAADSPSPYYIFNVPSAGGFVIVSGDDRTETILGYADEGCLSEDDMPDGLRCLLDDYAHQIAGLDDRSDIQRTAKKAPARHAIAPLIKTHWNQGAPYNNNSPVISEKHTVTGCVATSMAQVMYYHKWPQQACEPIPAFSTTTEDISGASYELTTEPLLGTTFNWNAMTLSYSSSDTGEAADAVAVLMQYCGWSLRMKYGLGVSSAYDVSITEALKTYFGYDQGVHTAFRDHYSYSEWISLLYSELAARRPMVFGGQSAGGGHSFICDGYDTDDYFHFNWGWGGSSDGYYRLSVLQPWEQGIGGSSTQDGFNFGQDAILGIKPPTENPSVDGYCLSLEGLHFGGDNATSTTMSFTRDAENGSFKNIELSVLMFSYIFDTNDFDAVIVLVNSSGQAFGIQSLDATGLTFNEPATWSPTLTIPSGVEDGTYYLEVWSRPKPDEADSNTAPWYYCYDGDQFRLKCVISGDNLTITVPIPANTLPTCTGITVNGDKTVGSELEVIASFTGGTGDYLGNLFLYVNNKLMMGKTVDIKAGQTADVRFVYTASEAGGNTLKITKARSTAAAYTLGSTTVNIIASDATNDQALTITPTINNLTADGKLYGNAMRLTATVVNKSTEKAYTGHVNCSLRMYNNIDDEVGDYYDAIVQTQHFTIPANSSTDLTFAYDGLDPTKCYRLRFSYLRDGNTADGPITASYAMGEGYALYAADGTASIHPSSEAITSSYAAASVDLRSISNLTDITASTNPNCIYFVKSGVALPTALEGTNVVIDGIASTLTLTDGYDLYTPFTFDATNVSYTRTFTLAAAGTSGWNTLFLPFDVSRVSVADGSAEGKTVDWFHSSSDTGKNFWLRTFTGDAANTVYFDFADEIAANTPYIIAVPDDRFGAAWQMTDKAVTFSGSNAIIAPPSPSSISGNSYKFTGSTVGKSLSDVYALNAEGSTFKHADNASVAAFRAWFCGASISSLALPALMIGNGSPADGIHSLDNSTIYNSQNGNCLDLSGRPVKNPHKSGLYIINGKKYMIK